MSNLNHNCLSCGDKVRPSNEFCSYECSDNYKSIICRHREYIENLKLIKSSNSKVKEINDMTKIEADSINHPAHYNSHPAKCDCGKRIECIMVTRHMGFNLGNVVKYIWRSDLKGGLEDLKKAQVYLADEIKKRENSQHE